MQVGSTRIISMIDAFKNESGKDLNAVQDFLQAYELRSGCTAPDTRLTSSGEHGR